MDDDDDAPRQRYRLKTSGREFDATRGIIGISPDGTVTEGAESDLDLAGDGRHGAAPWTAAERAELADEMIRRWSWFKNGRPS
jgi:hypothetical protein